MSEIDTVFASSASYGTSPSSPSAPASSSPTSVYPRLPLSKRPLSGSNAIKPKSEATTPTAAAAKPRRRPQSAAAPDKPMSKRPVSATKPAPNSDGTTVDVAATIKGQIKPTPTKVTRPTSAVAKRPTSASTATAITTKPDLTSSISTCDRDSLSLIFSFLSLHDFCTSLHVSHSWLQTTERVTSWPRLNIQHLIASYEPELTSRDFPHSNAELNVKCTIGGKGLKLMKVQQNGHNKSKMRSGDGDDPDEIVSLPVETKESEVLAASVASTASSSSSSSSPPLPKHASPFTRFLHTRIFHRATHIHLRLIPTTASDKVELEVREETREKLILFLEKTTNLQSLRLKVSAYQLGISDPASNTTFLDQFERTLEAEKFSTHLQFLELSSLRMRMMPITSSNGDGHGGVGGASAASSSSSSPPSSLRFYQILSSSFSNLRVLSINYFNDPYQVSSLTTVLEKFMNLEYLHLNLEGDDTSSSTSLPASSSPNFQLMFAIRALSLHSQKLHTLSLELIAFFGSAPEELEGMMEGLCWGEKGKEGDLSSSPSLSSSSVPLVTTTPPLTSLRFSSYDIIPLCTLLSSLPTLTDLQLDSSGNVQFLTDKLPENIKRVCIKGKGIEDDFLGNPKKKVRLPLIHPSSHITSCTFSINSPCGYFNPSLTTFHAWLKGMTSLTELTFEGLAINTRSSGDGLNTFDGLIECQHLQKLVLKQRPQVNMISLLRVIAQLPVFTTLEITISPAYTPASPSAPYYNSRTRRERDARRYAEWSHETIVVHPGYVVQPLVESPYPFTLPLNIVQVISSHPTWCVLRVHLATTYSTQQQQQNAKRNGGWSPNMKKGSAPTSSFSTDRTSKGPSMTKLLASHPKSAQGSILKRLNRFRLYHTSQLLENLQPQVFALHSLTSKRDPEGEMVWKQENVEGTKKR